MQMQLAVSTYSLAGWRSENGRSLEDSFDWSFGFQPPLLQLSKINPCVSSKELALPPDN